MKLIEVSYFIYFPSHYSYFLSSLSLFLFYSSSFSFSLSFFYLPTFFFFFYFFSLTPFCSMPSTSLITFLNWGGGSSDYSNIRWGNTSLLILFISLPNWLKFFFPFTPNSKCDSMWQNSNNYTKSNKPQILGNVFTFPFNSS